MKLQIKTTKKYGTWLAKHLAKEHPKTKGKIKINGLRYLFFAFAFIFLLASASALLPSLKEQPSLKTGLEISDTANEYPSIEIKDWMGLGGVKADLVLTEHTPSCGNDCMSQFQITTYSDSPLIDDVKFWKIDENGEQTLSNIRSYQFYIQTDQKEIQVDDYEYQCTDTGQISSNGTRTQTCENVKVGSHPETTPEWMPYTIGTEMPSGTYVVKLEGQKRAEWSYDWKIETQGKIINEWSVWSGTAVDTTKLYNNLTAYYGLEEASGNATDSTGKYTTNTASVSNYQVTGKVNYAYNMTGTSSILSAGLFTGSRVFNVSNMGITSYPFSFNVWIKPKTTQPYVEPTIMFLLNSASTQEYYWIGISSNNITMYTRNNLGSEEKLFSNASISSDAWVMVTTVWTSATERQFYINGVSIFNQTGSIPFGGSLNLFGLSSGSYSGLLDEAGLWSRTLNSSEISALYKSGAGLSYANFNQSRIVLNSPANNAIQTSNLVTTNATATVVGGATLVNMSLYDNSTGTWGLRNTTDISIGTYNETHGYNLSNTVAENANSKDGMKITVKSQNITLKKVYKTSASTPTTAYITKADDNNVVYASATFVGNEATFNYVLNASTSYRILTTHTSSSWTRAYSPISVPPTSGTYLDWITGITGGGAEDSNYYIIDALGISINSSSATITWNNTYTTLTNWGVQACDSDGACGFSENRTFSIDTQAPTINVLSPVGNIGYGKSGLNVTLNYSITDTNLASCWFEYNSTNTTIPCASNYSFLQGNSSQLSGKIWANDSVGNKNSADMNWIFGIFSNADNYNTQVVETSSQTFTSNYSYTGVSSSANLIYNGTAYPATISGDSSSSLASVTINIPTISISGNYTFYWQYLIQTTGTSYYNSTPYNQTVNTISAINITSVACSDRAYYFNFVEEENQTSLSNATIYYNFNYGITNGNSKNIYGNLTNVNSLYMCINSTLSPNWTIGQGEIQYEISGYSPRRYYIYDNLVVTNVTTNITLYNILTARQTSFSLNIVDNSLRPYTDKYTSLLRWYPQLNSYKTVEMGKTDAFGNTIIHTKTEDVDYRIAVYERNGTLIKLDDPTRMACLANPCTFQVKIIPSVGITNTYFSIDQTLGFNETTGIWRYIWNDASGRTQSMNLSVYLETGESSTLICSSQGVGTTGVIICNTSVYTSGTQKAVVYRTASPADPIISQTWTVGGSSFRTSFGLWISMLIAIPVIFFLATISPIAGIIGGIVALIPAWFLGSISTGILVGIAVLGGLIWHLIKRV